MLIVALMWYATHRFLWPEQDLKEFVGSIAKYVLAGLLCRGCLADPVCFFVIVILAANIHAYSWMVCVLWTGLAWHAALGYPSNWLCRACLLAFSSSVPLFGKRASMAAPDLRISKAGDEASVRWRTQSAAAVSDHRAVFLSHGMPAAGNNCHVLETVGMAVETARAIHHSVKLIIAWDVSFIDRYAAFYEVMKPHMAEVAGKICPKVILQPHPTNPQLARPQWSIRTGKTRDDISSGKYTHRATLRIMVDEINAKLGTLATLEECQAFVKDFLARQRQTAQHVQNQEAGKSSSSLDASKRAWKLHDAQAEILTATMLEGLKITDLLLPIASRNTFTGFKNFQQCSCYLNVLLQLFCHTDFVDLWMQADPLADIDFTTCLADIRRQHGAYECVAPFEILQQVLVAFECKGICANSQNDAMELLAAIREHLVLDPRHSEQMACIFPQEVSHDVFPDTRQAVTLEAYLLEAFGASQSNFNKPPRRLLLSKIPVCGPNDLDIRWIPYECSSWDAVLDMSLLMASVIEGEIRYQVKAAIFHVHRLQDRAVMTSGHYVIIVKQGDNWHLCNDEVVRAVDLQTTPYPPCCVYLERLDAKAVAKPCLRGAPVKTYTWQQIVDGIADASAAGSSSTSTSQAPRAERKPGKAQGSQSQNPAPLSRWFPVGVKRPREPDESGQQQDPRGRQQDRSGPGSHTHLRAHETGRNLVCRLLLEKKKKNIQQRATLDRVQRHNTTAHADS